MDPQRIQRCLERAAAYQASGPKAIEWASANGVSVHELAAWLREYAR